MTASVGGADESDSVDSASLGDGFGDVSEWNGRDIQLENQKHHKHALISQFYTNIFREVKEIKHVQVRNRSYDILDFTHKKKEELTSDFDRHHESSPLLVHHHPSSREFAPDPIRFQTEIAHFLNGFGKGVEKVAAIHPGAPASKKKPAISSKSFYFKTEGQKIPGMQHGFINGMDTTQKEFIKHIERIKGFTDAVSIEGVYNRTNTLLLDALEIFLLSYPGHTSLAANLLIENWTRFHEENKSNPDAKYLQFTHSMGNIIARNALRKAPKEIRDRVIIVAIAPAIIIPDGLCYESFHYASKNDYVHYGEDLWTRYAINSLDEDFQAKLLEQLSLKKERLILLEPHPDSKDRDHGFESKTFDPIIERHNKDYLKHNGQYK